MEGRGRTTHTTRMGGQGRRDAALASRRAPGASEIHSLSQTDMLKSVRSSDCDSPCALADARDSSARLALPERRPGTTFLWQLGDSASPSSA